MPPIALDSLDSGVAPSQPMKGEKQNGNLELDGVASQHPLESPQKPTCDVKNVHSSRDGYRPIAVVGMAMRLPGGVKCEKDLWDLLIEKKDGLCRVPESRYNVDSFYSDSRAHSVRTTHGYFLQDDPAEFDAGFFGISSYEASRLDPQQRLLLEVVWECMESAGLCGWKGKDIGCYVGVFGEDWLDLSSKDTQNIDRFHVLGTGNFALSNRISYEYDLTGPSMTFETGCSSSLVGFHEACQALQSGDCSSAIVAGTNLILSPTMTTTMSDNMVLAPDGICKTFDAAANGYGRGEAINAVYVKLLDDALADGDPIRAVIRSTTSNCDGKTPGITTPGSETQKQLILKAYERAGITNITDTAFFECHGTGTIVGDKAETSVVADLFQDTGTYIGAIKPNLGHSEGASGLTSIIKAVLSLEKSTIPPNIHFKEPSPQIPFKEARLEVPVSAMPWPKDKQGRVSVNCFGIGGANAHAVLDSASSFCSNLNLPTGGTNDMHANLLFLSASSATALQKRLDDMEEFVKEHSPNLNDLAYTLAHRREHLGHRSFLLAQNDGRTERSRLKARCLTPSPSLTFVFTGQGAQWPGMGRELLEQSASFTADIRKMDKILQGLNSPPGWTIEEELLKYKDSSRINEAELSQPICTAVQVGIVNLLATWGVYPSVVVGHSSGEIGAAYASKAIPAETAIIVAYYRGQIATSSRKGAMAAVGLGSQDVQRYLQDGGVVVACDNSPQSTTISGDSDKVEAVLEQIGIDKPDTFRRRLRVETAYHSDHMREVGEAYEETIKPHVQVNDSMIPLYSTVNGKVIHDPSRLDSSYWRENLESPVSFFNTVKAILRRPDESHVFLEIGPHSALSGPIRQTIQSVGDKNSVYIATLTREKHQMDCMLESLAHMWSYGVPVDLTNVVNSGGVLTGLPAYPWDHGTRHWTESRIVQNWRLRPFSHHELLGSRTLDCSDQEPAWRNVLRLKDVPWLSEHVLFNDIIFPGAGYIAMIGEAIYQTTGTVEFCVRNLLFKAPMFLVEDHAAEVITSLKPMRLTDMQDSDWYEFTIIAHDGQGWVKHCQGQTRADPSQTSILKAPSPGARKVKADSWYRLLANHGLKYGPRFRGLREITSDINGSRATATVEDDAQSHESHYSLHPAVIDQCLQLMSVAVYSGIGRDSKQVAIPSHIENIYIGKCKGPLSLEVSTKLTSTSIVSGDLVGIAEGSLCFSITRGSCFIMEDHTDGGQSKMPLLTRLEWKPDIDLMPQQNLLSFHPLRNKRKDVIEMTILVMLLADTKIRHLVPATGHLRKYYHWICTTATSIREGTYRFAPEAKELIALPLPQMQEYFKAVTERVILTQGDSSLAMITKLACHVLENAADIMEGKRAPLELLLEDDGLVNLYAANTTATAAVLERLTSLLVHSNPRMRILEIGAGTGGITRVILDLLRSPEGVPTYADYMFSDLSPGFFGPAQERFKEHSNINYSVLDISKDPTEQGFREGAYDLIIASNVLHATPSIGTALQHVRKLLVPGGRLLLQELCPEIPTIDYIMGILPGWWVGENDNRPDKPYLSPDIWNEELRNAGFTGMDAMSLDDDPPCQMNVNIISRALAKPLSRSGFTFVYRSTITEWARTLSRHFTMAGHTVNWSSIYDTPSATDALVVVLDQQGPFLQDMSTEDHECLKGYFQEFQKANILWVTETTQTTCQNPWYALVLGLARSLRKELGLYLVTVEIDTFDSRAAEATTSIFSKYQQERVSTEEPDAEYIIEKGVVHTGRFQWQSLTKQLLEHRTDNTPRKFSMRSCGILDTMEWIPLELPRLKENEVAIDVKYAALNFKDIMISMGVFGHIEGLGAECSGIVREVGQNVNHIQPGDRVAVAYSGVFQTRVVIPAFSCIKIPDNLSLEDAVTMTIAFLTVLYSLLYIGRLEKCESVLIHSASGAVGQAAIQLCQAKEAEIFVTVGNEDKAQYLHDVYQIPRSRIFNSRNTSFLPDLMRFTEGRGVDIVLNSLAGDLLHASWECVAVGGKMIELGKRDFLGHATLNMDRFLANRAFFGVDISVHIDQQSARFDRLSEQLLEMYSEGKIRPIHPIKLFDAVDATDAFRYMQKGVHMGKIVIEMPEFPSSLSVGPTKRPFRFKSEASYLLIGGLGGIGQVVSRWMFECGARHFVFLSRSAGQSVEHRELLHEIEALGGHATAVVGSISSMPDIQRAIASSEKPVTGVINMSMVLKDQNFLKMTLDEWKVPLDAKVMGTWNLHRALQHADLDFFVLFSSVCGLSGNIGQTNYAAANTFLDAFVQYRHGQGLAASVLDIGPVDEIGYVARDPKLIHQVRSASTNLVQEPDLLDALQVAILQSHSRKNDNEEILRSSILAVGMSSLKTANKTINVAYWEAPDARFRSYKNLESSTRPAGPSEVDDLRECMSEIENNPAILLEVTTVVRVRREIGKLITTYVANGQEMTEEEVSDSPIDSLMSIEIRNWTRRRMNIDVSLPEISRAGTVGGLSLLAVEKLKAKYMLEEQNSKTDG